MPIASDMCNALVSDSFGVHLGTAKRLQNSMDENAYELAREIAEGFLTNVNEQELDDWFDCYWYPTEERALRCMNIEEGDNVIYGLNVEDRTASSGYDYFCVYGSYLPMWQLSGLDHDSAYHTTYTLTALMNELAERAGV